jgi:hypothetical protein
MCHRGRPPRRPRRTQGTAGSKSLLHADLAAHAGAIASITQNIASIGRAVCLIPASSGTPARRLVRLLPVNDPTTQASVWDCGAARRAHVADAMNVAASGDAPAAQQQAAAHAKANIRVGHTKLRQLQEEQRQQVVTLAAQWQSNFIASMMASAMWPANATAAAPGLGTSYDAQPAALAAAVSAPTVNRAAEDVHMAPAAVPSPAATIAADSAQSDTPPASATGVTAMSDEPPALEPDVAAMRDDEQESPPPAPAPAPRQQPQRPHRRPRALDAYE